MAVMEVCLILSLMGVRFGVLGALVVEAMTKLVNVVGSINPGNFGTDEGGNMLIGKIFGLTAATGLVLGFTRRLRGFFWECGRRVGLVPILTRSRIPTMPKIASGRRASQKKKGEQTPTPPLRSRHEAVSPSPFSCPLGNRATKNSALDLLVLAHCPFCFETFWRCAR